MFQLVKQLQDFCCLGQALGISKPLPRLFVTWKPYVRKVDLETLEKEQEGAL